MTKQTIARFAGISAGAAMVLGFAAPAGAQTIAQLQAQIAALMAQLAALSGGASASAAITSDLTVGSTGSQVVTLQNALIAQGYLTMPAGVSTGYFGSLTASAVMKWQAANGLPATGYFGPLSRAKFGMGGTTGGTTTGGTTTGGTTSTSGPLTGGAGSIDSITAIANLSNEEVGEGEEDVEIAGIEIENGDESDIRLTAVRLDFSTQPTNDDLEDFITEVSVMLDGNVVARVDADEFNNNNDWTRTVSLNSSAIIRSGDTADLTVAVTGINNLDSGDAGDDWALDFISVRYVDAQGASITDAITYDAVNWSVVDFATAANVLLRVAADDDSVNEAHVIEVHATNETDNVKLLSFSLKAEGSDILVEDLPVKFDVTGAGTPNAMVTTVYLYAGNTEIASETMTNVDANATETITFDNIDYEINEDQTVKFTVRADFLAVSGALDEGDTISAQIGATERNAIVAEDEAGENLADADATGTAIGEAHAVYSTGIRVTMLSSTETLTPGADGAADDDVVNITMKFRVEAFGTTTVYLGQLASTTTYADGAATGLDIDDGSVYYRYEIDGVATTSQLASTLSKTNVTGVVSTDTTTDKPEWAFDAGEVADITLSVTRTNVATEALSDGFHRLHIVAFGWSTTEEDDTLEVYEFNMDDFRSDPIFAN